jgi:hypothetical protein
MTTVSEDCTREVVEIHFIEEINPCFLRFQYTVQSRPTGHNPSLIESQTNTAAVRTC